MSPALNGSSVLQRFECTNAVEIRDRNNFSISTWDCHICSLISSLPECWLLTQHIVKLVNWHMLGRTRTSVDVVNLILQPFHLDFGVKV